MTSRWERPEDEDSELEVDVRATPIAARAGSSRGTTTHVGAARRGAAVLRVVAALIPAMAAAGYFLDTWVNANDAFEQGIRQRIGSILALTWVPLTLGALVYAMSWLIELWAARIDQLERLDARRS